MKSTIISISVAAAIAGWSAFAHAGTPEAVALPGVVGTAWKA
jgi:hypothetical protein